MASKRATPVTCDLGRELSEMFRLNKTLIHLDLSQNNITKLNCEKMMEGLKMNHTLLGIHMGGNDCDLDSQGFMKDANKDVSNLHLLTRINHTLDTGSTP